MVIYYSMLSKISNSIIVTLPDVMGGNKDVYLPGQFVEEDVRESKFWEIGLIA